MILLYCEHKYILEEMSELKSGILLTYVYTESFNQYEP